MKKPCTLRILDEVNCVFLGLTPPHVQYFVNEYAILTDNHFFNPKFQLGRWDGKINFFLKSGRTYVHLLEELLPRVITLGYDVKIDDLRKTPSVTPKLIDANYFKDRGVLHPITKEPWIIRDYQVDMVNALLKHNGGVGIAGTGSGKTSVCSALALAYEEAIGYRSIIIVPDRNLTAQTFREYKNFGMDVGQYGSGIKDGDHQHIVSTWQTLQHHPTFIQQFKVVVVDEAHGLKGQVLQKLLLKYGKDIPFRFGVTGTLPRNNCDAMSITITVGHTQYTIAAHTLQDMNHLAKLQINIIQHEIDLHDAYDEYLDASTSRNPADYKTYCDQHFPDYAAEKRFMQEHTERTQWIANHIKEQHDKGKGNVLCLVNGIAFGKKLAAMIPDAIFLSGKDKMHVRQKTYDLFQERNDVTVIATAQIASTGLDIPRIFQLIGIDMGKSFIRTIQAIGRGLRKAEDKDFVTYTDFCTNLKYSKRHLSARKKYFREAKYKFKVYKEAI